jgi:hypothetical protein
VRKSQHRFYENPHLMKPTVQKMDVLWVVNLAKPCPVRTRDAQRARLSVVGGAGVSWEWLVALILNWLRRQVDRIFNLTSAANLALA